MCTVLKMALNNRYVPGANINLWSICSMLQDVCTIISKFMVCFCRKLCIRTGQLARFADGCAVVQVMHKCMLQVLAIVVLIVLFGFRSISHTSHIELCSKFICNHNIRITYSFYTIGHNFRASVKTGHLCHCLLQ